MNIRISCLRAPALALLFALFAFSAQLEAQVPFLKPPGHPPKLERQSAENGTSAYQAKSANLASSYVESVLYEFCADSDSASDCTDGLGPESVLIRDAAGNLYGTAPLGGANGIYKCGLAGCGAVFKVDSTGHETVLYSFCTNASCTDGVYPYGGLIQDAEGNLYGTTTGGGANSATPSSYGGGTIFKLAPPTGSSTTWTETVLYSFCSTGGSNCTDGWFPQSGLVRDAEGNFYGTTAGGGNTNATSCDTLSIYGPNTCGVVFKLDTAGHETVLYQFCSEAKCADGASPQKAGVIMDAAGNLYGTTLFGGANGDGTVFKLAPPTGMGTTWTESVLYSFCSVTNCTDGESLYSGLVQDAAGNLYGTTEGGGTGSTAAGTVFKLAPPAVAGGKWTESVLYSFCSEANCADGGDPFAALIIDTEGNLYGTTAYAGADENDGGTVFKLAPPTGSAKTWTETELYSFCSVASCADGANSFSALVSDTAGNLYGATTQGGRTVSVESGSSRGGGTLFKIAGSGFASNAVMVSPQPGLKLTSSTVTFAWTAGIGTTAYYLYVGTTPGADNIAAVNAKTSLSATVSTLPTNGGTFYVTLLSYTGSTWLRVPYTYIATGAGTGGTMTSPMVGSKLTSSTATFTWTAGNGIRSYLLYIGTTSGADNLGTVSAGSNTSATVTTLPTNGETFYVTLLSLNGATWIRTPYRYIASGTGTGGTITTPTPGSKFSSGTVTFDWTAGTGASSYYLYVGTTSGADNIAAVNAGSKLTATVTTMPTNGEKVYVTLLSLNGATWIRIPYTYTAFTSAEANSSTPRVNAQAGTGTLEKRE